MFVSTAGGCGKATRNTLGHALVVACVSKKETSMDLELERKKAEKDAKEIAEINRRTRERYAKDKKCCGCSGHAMEHRGDRYWCYTCGGWAKGCGR